MTPDPTFWSDRSVLLTGHTGFKGAWLSLWLQSLGARVHGLSLGVPTEPSLYELARVGDGMASSFSSDIRDPESVACAIASAQPEVVIHMAAQPFVRRSFLEPRATFDTNVMGTVNVLDAVRACNSTRAVLIVTSDKCYEKSEHLRAHNESSRSGGTQSESDRRHRAHRESDPLGGDDPYSSSKAAAELVTAAYRRSFFTDPSGPRVASARAGNVFGGGDWGEDRLIPDIVRAAHAGDTLRLRNPGAIRPWQHVLSPLGGYLMLSAALFESPEHACAWNFGPDEEDARTVKSVVQRVCELWPGEVSWERDEANHPPEASRLELDSSRARELLGWAPLMSLEEGLVATVEWFQAFEQGRSMREVTLDQIECTIRARAALG